MDQVQQLSNSDTLAQTENRVYSHQEMVRATYLACLIGSYIVDLSERSRILTSLKNSISTLEYIPQELIEALNLSDEKIREMERQLASYNNELNQLTNITFNQEAR